MNIFRPITVIQSLVEQRFSFLKFPSANADILEYGYESINGLAKFYALDIDDIGKEWRNFKYEVMKV